MSIYSQNISGGLPVLQCIDWLRLLRVTHWIKSTQTVFSGSYRDIVRNQLLSRLYNGGYALNKVISWREIRIDDNFTSLIFLTLSLASNISPAPIAIATTVRAPAKTRKRRSIRVRLFHQGTCRDKKLLRQNHSKSIFCQHLSCPRVWNYGTKGKRNYHSLSRSLKHHACSKRPTSHQAGERDHLLGWHLIYIVLRYNMKWWRSF